MLDKLFQPNGIAVVGASANKKKVGFTVLDNLISSGYRGRLYPINPKHQNILGKKSYPSILDVSKSVDVAVICVPSTIVASVLEQCGKKGVAHSIIISAGFSETGKEGTRRTEDLKKIGIKYDMRILGPNCLGFIDAHKKINASFADGMIQKGNTAFISQSGAIMTSLLDWANNINLGFSSFVSLGNKIDLDEVDFLEYFANDKRTNVVLGYLEGIQRGREFVETARKITDQKPFIVNKPGVSKSAKKAVMSHTATLAGDENAIRAAFDQANIIRTESLQEFFDVSLLFAWSPTMVGKNIAVVANAGGPGVIASDVISASVLDMAVFSEETKKNLAKNLPPNASIENPVDIIGDARSDRYEIALDAVLKDEHVDAVVVILTPQTVTEISKTAKVISYYKKKSQKPVIASFVGGKKVAHGIKILTENQVPFYRFPHEAINALEKMYLYEQRKKEKKSAHLQYKKIVLDLKKYDEFAKSLSSTHSKKQFSLEKTYELMQSYELPVIETLFIKHISEIGKQFYDANFPLVAKVNSDEILHKTDVKGVITNIRNIKEASDAFEKIQSNVKQKHSRAKISNIIFQEQIPKDLEIIIGAKRDAQFGPLIMFGLGGVYVELFKDVAFRLAPVSKTESLKMISETKTHKILSGLRGHAPYDIEKLSQIITRVSQLIIDFPQISEIDLNPVIVNDQGVHIVDFRILTKVLPS